MVVSRGPGGGRRSFAVPALAGVAFVATLWLAPPGALGFGFGSAAQRPRIVFLTPDSPNNTYWPQVFRIVRNAADDLGFEFEPHSLGVTDRYARQDEALRILAAEPRPDAAIATVVIGHTRRIMEA